MHFETLEAEALKLDSAGRAKLAKTLLTSLEALPEQEVERLWLDEAERRDAEFDAGIQGVPAADVLREARSRFR